MRMHIENTNHLSPEVVNQNKTLLIGLGNSFRGDDAVGLLVAKQIAQSNPENISIQYHEGEPIELFDLWQGYEAVILIDASYIHANAGTLRRYNIHEQTLPKTPLDASSHAFSLAAALDLAKTLNRLPKKLILYTIEGSSFAMGEGLSATVEEAADKLSRMLESQFSQPLS